MARIRAIKPQFFRHSELYDAEKETGLPLRLAYAGLWCVADREGRFKWKPREIKVEVLPYDEVDFGAVLDALSRYGGPAPFVVKYQSGGEWFGYIPKFKEHQHINKHEPESNIPAPPPEGTKTVRARAKTVRAPMEGNDVGNDDGMGREGKEVSAEPQAARAPAVPQEQPIVSLPTNRQGEEVPIFQAQALDYAKTYPNADVPQQFREMRRWLIDNPTKRKTARGMPKFINSWLSREQDKPNGTGRAGPSRTEGKQTRALGNFLEETRNETGNDAGRGTTGPPVPSERRALPLAASEIDDNERGFGPASDGDGRSFSATEQHDGSGIDPEIPDFLLRSTWAV